MQITEEKGVIDLDSLYYFIAISLGITGLIAFLLEFMIIAILSATFGLLSLIFDNYIEWAKEQLQ